MSKGNILQGQASGKLGDTVLMVRNGQQLARVYTMSGARSGSSASEAARIQRVKFGGGSNQWSLYRYVCTRMYRKGRSSRQSDYNYFVKKNSLLLPYFTKDENTAGVHVLQPGQFSSGSLGRIELVHSYDPVYVENKYNILLANSTTSLSSGVSWSSSLSTLKSALASLFPNASKVSFLISVAEEIEIEETSQSFVSQSVSHSLVVIDLYEETSSSEETVTVADYFAAKLRSDTLKEIVSSQSGSVTSGPYLFMLRGGSQDEVNFLGKVAVLVFATDDVASDCYTTIVPEDGINPTAGCYADWAAYRTDSALKLACISYGYQSGVMRDDIASVGNDLSQAVTAYASRLASVDADLKDSFLKSIGDINAVSAKKVVKQDVEKKEG